MPLAARVLDPVTHPIPPVLTGGPGSPDVMIGGQPAWRALPASVGAALDSLSNAMNSFMTTPVLTPASAASQIAQISQSMTKLGAEAAAAGSPGTSTAASSGLTAVNTTNTTLTATWTTASAAPGGQPAANVAYTEGIKAAMAGAATATLSSMAGISDMHTCGTPVPIPPHGPGFVTKGASDVFVNGLPLARQNDKVMEAAGGANPIAMGCPTVNVGDSGGSGGGGGGGGAGGAGASAASATGAESGSDAGAGEVATTDAAPTGFSGSGGKEAYSDSVTTVKTGVELQDGGKATAYKDALSIELKCDKDPHVLQFVSREIIGADGKPIKRKLKSAAGEYETTMDPKNPIWNTDSAAKPNPYYEAGGASSSSKGSLTIYDQPSLAPGKGETWRATFKSYLICDGKVLREVTWVRSQKDGESPKYSVSVAKASSLPKWATDQLKAQGYNAAP